jgi:hypothetical protein
MGWSTTVVVPPDGEMARYMASLEKLRGRDDRVYYPAHGRPITNPQQYVRGLIGHPDAAREADRECWSRRRARPIRRLSPTLIPGSIPGQWLRLAGRCLRTCWTKRVASLSATEDMENRRLSPVAIAAIAGALLLGLLIGVAFGVADKIFGGPDQDDRELEP